MSMQKAYLEMEHYNKLEIADMIARARNSYLNRNECEVTDTYAAIDNFVNYLYAMILAPEVTIADD
jgi:ribosome-associated translation inhibitor RaiA